MTWFSYLPGGSFHISDEVKNRGFNKYEESSSDKLNKDECLRRWLV